MFETILHTVPTDLWATVVDDEIIKPDPTQWAGLVG